MKSLELSDLLDLVQYEKQRQAVRAEMMEIKARRRLPLNGFLTLLFENRRTVWYQVQEMARAERMVEDAALQGELDTYGPLVPSGSEWKATLYIEIPEEGLLKKMLPTLVGVEHSIFARIGGLEVRAAGEEGRSREDYTSTVHYLTFTLPAEAVRRLRAGEPLYFGSKHAAAACEVETPGLLREELSGDLDG